MTPRQRRWIFLIAGAGLVAFYLWGLSGLPGFRDSPGPPFAFLRMAVRQTNATGKVSAINFDQPGAFDTVGEEVDAVRRAAG